MSELRDKIVRAAQDRDRYELRDLARNDRYAVEDFMRYDARFELSRGEQQFVKGEFCRAGLRGMCEDD